ncbi:hypothetical protein Clacol_006837 [Clathrus columnatus]|uniref:GPI mannosyltransferase 1 n=1 Tax=Clathrus columnatus TaxID=1419009 RepID=A0AAV5AIT1_9AGAM|nr:hypothetical protein Clacol_006837 [Clathrus columnatus]
MQSILNWFWDVLSQLGLLHKNAKILFLGLDNAGKTVSKKLLCILVCQPFTRPLKNLPLATSNSRHMILVAINKATRRLWRDYFPEVDGIIFLVDSADHVRFAESKAELDSLLSIEALRTVPFMVLGNKIDDARAVSEEELRHQLGLYQTTGKGKVPLKDIRPIEIFMCSVVQRQGYGEAAALRLGLVIYSEYHDKHAVVKYTDVDYRVFTDAAGFLLKPNENNTSGGPLGRYLTIGSPYSRETYRYTPLLALLMTPNILLHPSFGKIMFSSCDLVIGWMLYTMLCFQPPFAVMNQNDVQRKATVLVSLLWLLNPLVFSISTRGSSESVLGLLVIGTLFSIVRRHHTLAAILFGLSVHWKIYPIIYGASILAFYGALSSKNAFGNWFTRLFTVPGLKFGTISALTFFSTTGATSVTTCDKGSYFDGSRLDGDSGDLAGNSV